LLCAGGGKYLLTLQCQCLLFIFLKGSENFVPDSPLLLRPKLFLKKYLKKESVSVKVPSILKASFSRIHYGDDSPKMNRFPLKKQNLFTLETSIPAGLTFQ
jgi:hypothetical protein